LVNLLHVSISLFIINRSARQHVPAYVPAREHYRPYEGLVQAAFIALYLYIWLYLNDYNTGWCTEWDWGRRYGKSLSPGKNNFFSSYWKYRLNLFNPRSTDMTSIYTVPLGIAFCRLLSIQALLKNSVKTILYVF